MKKTRKVTRVKLHVDQINDFILLGLVSCEPDYKLSLALNKKFSVSLRNISPVKITGENGNEHLFSKFSDTSGSPDRSLSLISNRSGKYFLISKLKNIDYILNLHDPDNKKNLSQIISDLREITSITAVFNIEIDSVKDKNLQFVIQ